MISILIPRCDEDCSRLVVDLRLRAESEGTDVEILVGTPLPRAANRNALADRSRGDWLLFVDADAAVPPDFSFQAYANVMERAVVVCGGLRHPDHNPNPAATLRYRYERAADRRRAARFRAQAPYDRFTTFNLLVRRDVFMQVRFDERIRQYGYEDVAFAAELERRGIAVLHIDNPLLHMGLDANPDFLAKTETALRTAASMAATLGSHSHVAQTATRLARWHMDRAAAALFRLTRPLLRSNLLSRHPSLTVFALYKLGFYLNLSPTKPDNAADTNATA